MKRTYDTFFALFVGCGELSLGMEQAGFAPVFAEDSRSRKRGKICSADFIKCAGERKPHFIKCGFGDAAEDEASRAA